MTFYITWISGSVMGQSTWRGKTEAQARAAFERANPGKYVTRIEC